MSSVSVSLASSPKYPSVKLVPRLSEERGHANHGWLKTFHTFNFANYFDSRYNSFGALRVINEDRVEPMRGFGKHSHREMEIFSYVVSGELEHQDSMGNLEILKRGDVQMTSAGTGITHSEHNRNSSKQVHFLQVWVQPNVSRLTPQYFTRHFSDEEKKDKLVKIVAQIATTPSTQGPTKSGRDGSGPAPVHAGLSLYATILSPTTTVAHTFPAPVANAAPQSGSGAYRKAYVHVIQTSGYNTGKASGARVCLNGGLELSEGDGAFALGLEGDKIEVENIGDVNAEVLVFDVE